MTIEECIYKAIEETNINNTNVEICPKENDTELKIIGDEREKLFDQIHKTLLEFTTICIATKVGNDEETLLIHVKNYQYRNITTNELVVKFNQDLNLLNDLTLKGLSELYATFIEPAKNIEHLPIIRLIDIDEI